MERNIRDVLEEEVIYDHSQFGLLNNEIDDNTLSPSHLNEPLRAKRANNKWGRLMRTAALCGAYISLGLCFSVTGPTLLYLKDQVGATIPEISYIFTLRSAGTLGGAFLGGFLLDRCNPYSAFFVIIALMAISIGAMPWCKHLWMLMVSSVIIGVGNGMLDTGASTLCLQLWGKDSGPYMQALHFSFAVGGSIAPLLVQAFIVETINSNNTISSRHVRSVTSPFNSSDENDQSTTMTSIIQAVTNLPDTLELGSTNATLSTVSSISATSTVSTPIVLQNLTTITEKPKKPKPEVINGQAFGDSSQFDKIPLKIEPPKEDVASTTTTAATTTASIEAVSPLNNVTIKAQELNTTNSTIIQTSTASVESNLNGTLNGTLIESAKNESSTQIFPENDTIITPSTKSSLNIETSMITTPLVPIISFTNVSKSDALDTSKSNQPNYNVTTDVTDKISTSTLAPSATTIAATTTLTSLATSPSPQPSVVLNSSLKTTAFTTQSQPVSTVSTTTIIPTATTMSSDQTEAMVIKSRGKFRGQQDEISTEVLPTTAIVPVINTERSVNVIGTTTNAPLHNDSENIDQTPIRVSDYLERFGVTRMHMLYTVIAIIVLHTAFAFLFFLCSGTRNSALMTAERHTADRKIKPWRPSAKFIFVALMFSFYLMYVGSEVIFAQFLTTFALESPLKLPTSTANYITTTFWVSFAAGRFVAIFVAHFTNPTIMLIFNMGATAVGSMALCIAAQTNVPILYVGSALVGVGMASTFATGFVWTETNLLVTNRISAAFSVASSMGEMIFPTVTGSLIESHPMSLMYLVLGLTLLCGLTFALAWFLAKRKERGGSNSRSGYRMARQAEDDLSQN